MYRIFLLPLLLLLLACPPAPNASGLRTAGIPTEENLTGTDLRPGVQEGIWSLTSGTNWAFRLSVPERAEQQKLLLVIAMHWAGGPTTYKEYASCLAESGLAELNAIIFSPQDLGLGWQDPGTADRISVLIDLAIAHWPVDSNKIILTGYSNGGIGAWKLANQLSDKIAASIPMAGVYTEASSADVPYFVIHGVGDELFPIAQARQTTQRATRKGADVTFYDVEGKSHYMACGYVEELKMAARDMMDGW